MHRSPLLSALVLASALLLAACGGVATPTAPRADFGPVTRVQPTFDPFTGVGGGAPSASVPRIWFVEVDAAPVTAGGSVASVGTALASVQQAAAAAGVDATPRFTFGTFVSGFSVEADVADVLALAGLPGVRSVSPVGLVDAPQVERHAPGAANPDLFTALAMTGADTAQSELGFTGAGIRVGIVDTGIMLNHPEFAGRIVAGFDFVGDLYDAGDLDRDEPTPEPAEGTRPGGGDCNGHGTHVAGIVGAGGVSVTGVAPEALLGAYRVFGCDGSSHSDVILAAVERAFADGMDVVNLSLGSNNGWPQDFLAVALARMAEVGMIPVASAGNNGASGVYTIGSPGAGDAVITVASIDNTSTRSPSMLVDGESVAYTNLTGAPLPPTSGTTPEIVYVGRGCAADAYLADPTGLVALITRGACSFAEKYERAFAEGAVGVVIENNVAGPLAGTLGGTYEDGFGVGVSGVDGAFIRGLITSGPAPTITWTDDVLVVENPTGFLASAFSSYGLAPDLSLKPDLAAPGGLITSAMIDGASPGVAGTPGYAVLSGTSMSSPHVAGAVALFLEARPDVDRRRVRDHLLNAASPVDFALAPGAGLLESVHRQGAGLLQIDAAIESRTTALPAKLALGESADGAFVGVVTLHNDAAVEVTFALGQIEEFGLFPVATAGDSNDPDFFVVPPLVTYAALRQSGFFDPIDQVTVPAGGVASFQVRIEANPDAPNAAVYGTYLAFLPISGAAPGVFPVLVPAAGFAGDYQALPTFTFEPFLAFVQDGSVFELPEGWAFTMRNGDVPTFGFALAHGAERLTVEVVPQDERAWIGPQPGFEAELMRRENPGFVSIYGFGDFDASALPSGSYTIRTTVLKPGGDPTNPAHRVVVETPTFVIDRFLQF